MSVDTAAPVDDLAAELPPILPLVCAEDDSTKAHIATVATAITSADFFPDTRISFPPLNGLLKGVYPNTIR